MDAARAGSTTLSVQERVHEAPSPPPKATILHEISPLFFMQDDAIIAHSVPVDLFQGPIVVRSTQQARSTPGFASVSFPSAGMMRENEAILIKPGTYLEPASPALNVKDRPFHKASFRIRIRQGPAASLRFLRYTSKTRLDYCTDSFVLAAAGISDWVKSRNSERPLR